MAHRRGTYILPIVPIITQKNIVHPKSSLETVILRSENGGRKKIFISSKESGEKLSHLEIHERCASESDAQRKHSELPIKGTSSRKRKGGGEGKGRAWKEKNSNTSLGLRHDLNARFLRATGHLHTIPLLPRTIKANRILDDPCRYPPFNLYTTTSVLQRRGINGPCHPVRNKSPCIVIFRKKGRRCASTRPSPNGREERVRSSAEFANNRNRRGYPRVLPPRFNSCYGECGGSEGGPLARKPRVAKGGGKPKLCSINEDRQLRSKRVFNGIQARFVCWQQWMPNVRLHRESLDKVESYPFQESDARVASFDILFIKSARGTNF